MEEWIFRRPLKLSNAFGKPSLIIFSDGSMQAYVACTYVRWQIGDKFLVCLIVAKHKIAPVRQLSVPRLELFSVLIAARLRGTRVKEFYRSRQ